MSGGMDEQQWGSLEETGNATFCVLRIANKIAPDTQVVLLTAHGSLESAITALRLGAHDYLLKPASPTQILRSVNSGLSRRAEQLRKRNLLEQLETRNGFPVLDDHFETSVPGLFITSMPAVQDFGPFFGFTNAVRTSARLICERLKHSEQND